MGDDDYAIETADAGASTTIPMEAGQIKKGGWVDYKCRYDVLPAIVPLLCMAVA